MNIKPKITQQELETIERYLDNEMTAAEQESFNATLSQDATLQQLVNEVRALRDGVEAASIKELLETFHSEIPQAHSKVVQEPNLMLPRKKNSRFYWGVAASIVVLFGLYWILAEKNINEALYAAHFQPDPGLPTTMGTSDNYEFFDAMVDYKLGNYQQAIQKWETQLQGKPENDTLHYFLGVAKLALNREGAAISHLEKVMVQSQSIFIEDTYYYLGLAALKKGNVEAAKTYLEKSGSSASRDVLEDLP
jgi:tetratricopeptide (TPR) repeat protein